MMSLVIQSHLLNLVRTGDPTLDAMIAGLIVTMITYVATNYRAILDHLKHGMRWRKCIMHVPSIVIVGEERRPNGRYANLTWFLSERVDLKKTSEIKAFRYFKNECIPDDGKVVWHNHNRNTLSIWHKTDEVRLTDKIFTKQEICVSARSTDVLQDFMRHVEDEHTAHNNKKIWAQIMYVIKEAPDKTKFWSPIFTNNTKTLETVVLKRHQHREIKRDLEAFLDGEDLYKKLGIAWTRGYFLTGHPGTGKTSLVKAISEHAKMNIWNLNLSAIKTDAELHDLFQSIPKRAIILIEDIDCMNDVVHTRSEEIQKKPIESITDLLHDGNVKTFTLSGLLNQLDGVFCGHGQILIMTSNHPQKLDPALLRPGRVDLRIDLESCTPEQTSDFFDLYFGEPLPDKILQNLPVKTPAEVSNICLSNRENKEEAVRRLLQAECPSASWIVES